MILLSSYPLRLLLRPYEAEEKREDEECNRQEEAPAPETKTPDPNSGPETGDKRAYLLSSLIQCALVFCFAAIADEDTSWTMYLFFAPSFLLSEFLYLDRSA